MPPGPPPIGGCSANAGDDEMSPASRPREAASAGAAKEETRRDQEAQAFALKWAEFLRQSSSEVTDRLLELANVVAAPLDGLPSDLPAIPFDLLLLEDAHLLTEADLPV